MMEQLSLLVSEVSKAESPIDQAEVERIYGIIMDTAKQSYRSCKLWPWITDDRSRFAGWISINFAQSDYGLAVDKRVFSLAYRRVGVEVGNLPAFVLEMKS